MNVKELIEQLSKLPQDAPILVMDSERMAYNRCGDGSSEGLYYDFEVDEDKEMFFKTDEYEDDFETAKPTPTVVISIQTDYIEVQEEIKELRNLIQDANELN